MTISTKKVLKWLKERKRIQHSCIMTKQQKMHWSSRNENSCHNKNSKSNKCSKLYEREREKERENVEKAYKS